MRIRIVGSLHKGSKNHQGSMSSAYAGAIPGSLLVPFYYFGIGLHGMYDEPSEC